MSKKEEKAYEYSKKISNLNPKIKDFVECSFMVGWDCALKNQWIKVEERTPNANEEVLVLFEDNGEMRIETDVYYGDNFYILHKWIWNFGGSKVIAWMPIPSFDEILKENKDVLKLLKGK